jgi:DNA end-binding protein Ku
MAMAPRAFWKGYLKLSLVSCPIALFRATVPINEIESADIIGGEGDDGELEAPAIDPVIEINEFVLKKEIDERYLGDSYYIVPDREEGLEAFAVIREAIRKQGVVGISKVRFRSGEHIIALEARGKGMVGVTLHFSHEVETVDQYFDDIRDMNVPQEMIELAQHIVMTKTVQFEPKRLADQILGPMTRERRGLEKRDGPNAVPASDRTVRLDHNSPKYSEAMGSLQELEQALNETNLYEDPEEKEQHVAQVSAARRLLQSTKVRVIAVSTLLTPVVVAIVKKFFDTTLGQVAQKVIDTVWPLLGMIF